MKKGIHPKYMEAAVTCACGAKRGTLFRTMATVPEIKLDICSECHPFYTGKQRLVDTTGRIDRFRKRYNIAAEG